jgi:DMSO/TMAO reductase YedYZ molybdopterin-dependent catalytic subunit
VYSRIKPSPGKCRTKPRPAFTLLFLFFSFFFVSCGSPVHETVIQVTGDLGRELSVSVEDLRAMPSFELRDVPVIPARARDRKDEELVTQTSFRGVLLRDVLYRAGMKHKRKWEPGVLIQVRNKEGREVVFSFGEIFYSSIGRSVLIAYERDSRSFPPTLVVATDIHGGRMIENIAEINVSRVDVELLAYEDKAGDVVRPSSAEFTFIDTLSGAEKVFTPADFETVPLVHVPDAVLIGDCEGYHGIHSLDGVPLRVLLRNHTPVLDPASYDRYVLITSDDGYTATFSFGELFNSRMGDQIVIATLKNDKPLTAEDGFAMSIVGEDSTGGRSVNRISRIEVR